MKLPTAIHLKPKGGAFYNTAVFIYILHMAVMADLTFFYPEHLMRFRMPSFLLVAALAAAAVGGRILTRGVPLRPLIFYLSFFFLVFLGALYSGENLLYIRGFIDARFLKYCLIFSALFLFEDEPDIRVRQLTVVALAALLVYHLGLSQDMFLNDKGQMEYMTVGYGMAPWWIILAQGVFYYQNKVIKLFCLAASCYFAADIAVYGNRGALLSIAVSIGVFLVVYLPLKYLALFSGGFLAAMVGVVAFLPSLLNFVGSLLGLRLDQSRNLRLLTGAGLTYDSGRFPIFRACWEGIVHHPLLGNGVGGDRILTTDHGYVHNIVLELCVDFGVFFGLLAYGWLLYIGFRMLFRCTDRNWRALFLPFYIFSMVQLFFSSSLYASGYLIASAVIYLSCLTWHPEIFSKAAEKELPLLQKACRDRAERSA